MERVVSIWVLSYERQDRRTRVLKYLREESCPGLPIIVVDNAAGAELTDTVQGNFPRVRLIELAENLGAAARNAGIGAGCGEIMVTLDHDVWLSSLLEMLHTEEPAAFRRSVLDQVKPYGPESFILQGGSDLALRPVDPSHEIWYLRQLKGGSPWWTGLQP